MQWLRALLGGMLALAYTAAPALRLPSEEDAPRDTAAPPPQSPPPEDERQRPPAPATGFTPSEKIGADSAVSFPVDI